MPPTSLLRSLLYCGLLGLAALPLSCSDKDRRMPEGETLAYKRQLVYSHWGKISTSQANDFLYYPGRTQGEIDTYFEKLLSDFAAQKKADEASWLKERKSAATTSSGTGGEGNP